MLNLFVLGIMQKCFHFNIIDNNKNTSSGNVSKYMTLNSKSKKLQSQRHFAQWAYNLCRQMGGNVHSKMSGFPKNKEQRNPASIALVIKTKLYN